MYELAEMKTFNILVIFEGFVFFFFFFKDSGLDVFVTWIHCLSAYMYNKKCKNTLLKNTMVKTLTIKYLND